MLGVLREDELAVPDDVELTFAARRRLCIDSSLLKHGHETRGTGLVAASGRAIVDLDPHVRSLQSAWGATRPAILGGVDEEDLRKLEAVGSELAFGAGQMLIERGKPGTGLYVVLEGKIVVEAPEGTTARPSAPPPRITSASTVGLPRESMTWRARTLTILVDISE